jgi:hypothetical protein
LIAVLVAQVQIVQGVRAAPPAAFDFGNEPMRYLENARLKLGINLGAGGAVTYLEDKFSKSGNMTYQTDIIVGSLDEIRAYARKRPRHVLFWRFSSDRLGWSYEHAADAGWPVRDGLKITYQKDPRGSMQSDVIFWKAEDAPVLKIEASFRFDTPGQALQAEVVIQPFGPADRTDFPAWQVQDPVQKEAIDKKRKQFPPAPALIYPLEVRGDGTLRTHILKLGKNPDYRGGMKQLQLRFPPVDGTAEVRRIGFSS